MKDGERKGDREGGGQERGERARHVYSLQVCIHVYTCMCDFILLQHMYMHSQ